jgi:hypothetical protein
MIEKESIKDIARWVYLNTLFLFKVNDSLENKANPSIVDLRNEFLKDNSIPAFNFKNQGAVISSLEKILFYIKECLLEKEINDCSILSRQKFIFLTGDSKMSNWNLLKNLRNSVAHGDYDIVPSLNTYVFKNRGKFEVKIQHGDLGYFLSELGKKFLF